MTIEKLKKKIIPILQQEQVVKAGVFGSFVRGEQRKDSDVDILIEYKKKDPKTLLDFVGLKLKLGEKLGREVDLVEYPALHPLLKDRILKEVVPVL